MFRVHLHRWTNAIDALDCLKEGVIDLLGGGERLQRIFTTTVVTYLLCYVLQVFPYFVYTLDNNHVRVVELFVLHCGGGVKDEG